MKKSRSNDRRTWHSSTFLGLLPQEHSLRDYVTDGPSLGFSFQDAQIGKTPNYHDMCGGGKLHGKGQLGALFWDMAIGESHLRYSVGKRTTATPKPRASQAPGASPLVTNIHFSKREPANATGCHETGLRDLDVSLAHIRDYSACQN
jgi:hypothetical protein